MREGQGRPITGLYYLLRFCDFYPTPLARGFSIGLPRGRDKGLWLLAGCSHQGALRSHYMVWQLINHTGCGLSVCTVFHTSLAFH